MILHSQQGGGQMGEDEHGEEEPIIMPDTAADGTNDGGYSYISAPEQAKVNENEKEKERRKLDAETSKLEVRLKMARYYANGVSPSQIVKLLASEYPLVSTRTIWRYWVKRNEWLPSLTAKDASKTTEAVDKMLLALEESRRMAYATYVNADSSSSRVGAIGKYQESIRLEAELRQSLGLLPSKPIEIEARGMNQQNLILQIWMPQAEAERQAKLGRIVIDAEGKQVAPSTSSPSEPEPDAEPEPEPESKPKPELEPESERECERKPEAKSTPNQEPES